MALSLATIADSRVALASLIFLSIAASSTLRAPSMDASRASLSSASAASAPSATLLTVSVRANSAFLRAVLNSAAVALSVAASTASPAAIIASSLSVASSRSFFAVAAEDLISLFASFNAPSSLTSFSYIRVSRSSTLQPVRMKHETIKRAASKTDNTFLFIVLNSFINICFCDDRKSFGKTVSVISAYCNKRQLQL